MRYMMKQPIFKLFGRKRRNNGAMWASIAGMIGLGAAIFGFTRGKQRNLVLPMKNIVKNFSANNALNNMDNAALSEFSEELLASALNKSKQ